MTHSVTHWNMRCHIQHARGHAVRQHRTFVLPLLLLQFMLAGPAAQAAPTLINPFTISATYDVPPGSPAATDVCFQTGTPFEFNTFNTVSLDLAYTGPLGGSPVEIQASAQGSADSTQHPNEICFFFPDTPVQPGETLNLIVESDDVVPDDFDFGPATWTFSEDLGQFEYPVLDPAPFPPVQLLDWHAERRRGLIDPNDLLPFVAGDPDPVIVRFDDGMQLIHVSEPGGLALLGMTMLALSPRRRRWLLR